MVVRIQGQHNLENIKPDLDEVGAVAKDFGMEEFAFEVGTGTDVNPL